jgi:hypothetical protein
MKKAFDTPDKREELRERLNEIEGVSLPKDAIYKRPGIAIVTFSNEGALKRFLEVMDCPRVPLGLKIPKAAREYRSLSQVSVCCGKAVIHTAWLSRKRLGRRADL